MPPTTPNAMNPKSLANLKARLAPDELGLTDRNSKSVSVRLHVDVIAAIAALDGDRSYHIRQAVKAYLQDWNNLKASRVRSRQEPLPEEEYDPVADTILFYSENQFRTL